MLLQTDGKNKMEENKRQTITAQLLKQCQLDIRTVDTLNLMVAVTTTMFVCVRGSGFAYVCGPNVSTRTLKLEITNILGTCQQFPIGKGCTINMLYYVLMEM